MIDYTIFYKHQLPVHGDWSCQNEWDLFMSAYVPTDRAAAVYEKARAADKRSSLPGFEVAYSIRPSRSGRMAVTC